MSAIGAWVAMQWPGLTVGAVLVAVLVALAKMVPDQIGHKLKVRREAAAHRVRIAHEQAARQADDALRIAREQAAAHEDEAVRLAGEVAARRQQEAERIENEWMVVRRCEGRGCTPGRDLPEWFFHERQTPHLRLNHLVRERICRACRSNDGILGEVCPHPGESEADFELRMAPFYEIIAAEREKGRLAALELEAEGRAKREGAAPRGDGE